MTGIILLAAGESSRFGRPKQLVGWKGNPLLRHAVETAIGSGIGPVLVVLGAVDQPCRDCLSDLDLTIIHNPDWRQGMGSSIAAGMNAARDWPLDGVIIMLCDQPLVTPQLLQELVSKSAGHPIVHAFFKGQAGPPVWFSQEYFDHLGTLSGNAGAKALILSEPNRVQIDFPDAEWDVDTLGDLAALDAKAGAE